MQLLYALEKYPTDLVYTLNTEGIEAFDFHKVDEVLARGDDAAEKFAPELIKIITEKTCRALSPIYFYTSSEQRIGFLRLDKARFISALIRMSALHKLTIRFI